MDRIQIADYLAKKVFNEELKRNYNVMLINKQIYPMRNYGELVEANKISPEDAFVFINFNDHNEDESYNLPVEYLYPLIYGENFIGIEDSYLAKLGFYYYYYGVYPATGLKYYGVVRLFSDRLVIELVDICIVVVNTRLVKVVEEVLGKDILTQNKISYDQLRKIDKKFEKQKLFAGHNTSAAYSIINDYYKYHNISLAKEVLAITNAYNQIFEPYRVVYDTSTRQQVLM